jgi:colanic acid biosynthesis glycosyl transferase WcaI
MVVVDAARPPRLFKVLLLNQAFYPDVVSSGQHASDLAVGLAERGHQVTVVTSDREYDNPSNRFPRKEQWNGVRIRRVSALGLGKGARWRRAADFASFMAGCAVQIATLPRMDVIVAMTSPPLVSYLARLFVPLRAPRLVVWALDLNPDEAIAAGWLRERSIAGRLLGAMLRSSLRRADAVIALDRFMKQRIIAKGVPADRVSVIAPWAHDDVVRFDPAGREAFRLRHGLAGKFVVMYSGNHSPCHPLDTLVEAAELLSSRDDIVFCFVGGGSEHGKIRQLAVALRLRNIICLPYQRMDDLAASLSAADLHVVVMGEPFRGIVHPCKIYNILAVGAPVLYVGPDETHITDLSRTLPSMQCRLAHMGDTDAVIRFVAACATNSHLRYDGETIASSFSKRTLMPQLIAKIEQANTSGHAFRSQGAS